MSPIAWGSKGRILKWCPKVKKQYLWQGIRLETSTFAPLLCLLDIWLVERWRGHGSIEQVRFSSPPHPSFETNEILESPEQRQQHKITSVEDPRGELTAQLEELLNTLSNKFAGVSSEIFAKMDEMSRRLDNIEAQLSTQPQDNQGGSK
ncbi:hypothetical protein OOU_Y34scaffold00094g86 [Pyricularia oryzae Y34]|uniref:Uncharacterized protein n=2 Tax=Pyricularia oryzae TaxID=318829 RepID=A0AA97P947_PYRO3|nr:hypothetical protein OOU_Y34scaffold00094g86 [Pyricularia oryzae Y34]